jgi:Amt family ammonium transporter
MGEWLNKGDNAWQMTAATIVGMQSMPGLVILYGGIVKKKWAVNSAFMALYAFAAVLVCWVTWAYKMSFGEELLPMWGKAGPVLSQSYLLGQALIPATAHLSPDDPKFTAALEPAFPAATLVYFQFVFAAITVIILAGSLLGRMSFKAWMLFVPLWLTFSYSVSAFSLWGGGFLFHWGVLDFAGGYVIHVSSGVAGYVAAFWVSTQSNPSIRSFLQFLPAIHSFIHSFIHLYARRYTLHRSSHPSAYICVCCSMRSNYRIDSDRLESNRSMECCNPCPL